MNLLDYQKPHAEIITNALRKDGLAFDGSDPGTGKTFVASFAAKKLHSENHIERVLAIVPKVSIPVWKRVLSGFGVPVLDVVNYEKLRMGNTGYGQWKTKRTFDWTIPEKTLLIWDEAHRCKGQDSQNAKMLRDSKGQFNLVLSATLAESPLDLRAAAHIAGLAEWYAFWGWARHNGCYKGRFGISFDKRRTDVLASLHAEFFKTRGGRIRIADLGDKFPETQISAEALDFGDKIDAIYHEMDKELAALDEAEATDKPAQQLTIQLRARQRVELCKVPGIVSLAKDFVESGESVAIFTNFRATLDALCEKLGTDCAIYGDQSPVVRQQCIEAFQKNEERIIVVNIQAGGVSLSLHDESGKSPRVALICPTFSATDLRQALGRVHRAGGGKSLQRILFAAGTIEEKVCMRVQSKLKRLDLLNDGDLEMIEKDLNESHDPVSHTAPGLIRSAMPSATTQPLAHAERSHSKHSPSSLVNKAKCEGWFNDPDPNRDTTAADRGTLGHEMVEKEDFDLASNDLELTSAAKQCHSFLQRFYKPESKHFKELRLQILDQYGHLDHLFVHADGTADLIDLKFARNIYGADTAQFWAYSLGVWDKFPDVNEIKVWVLHPFLDHIDIETFTRDADYDRLCATVAKIIRNAEDPNPDSFKIGKHCTYCGRLKSCRKWAELGVEIANRYTEQGKKFQLPQGSVHGSDIGDPETLAVLWRLAPLVQKAADGWRKAALTKRLDGEDIPGLELVERRGTRVIRDPQAAYEAVKDRVSVEDFIAACDVQVTALENVYAASAPKGGKAAAKKELMGRLSDNDAVSSGAPVHMLRELK